MAMNRYRWLCLVPMLCLPLVAETQQPDAGSNLRDIERDLPTLPPAQPQSLPAPADPAPAPAGADEVRLFVAGYQLHGNQLFDDSELLPLLTDLSGQELPLSALYEAAARLTEFYRARGYLLSRAYLPEQDVTDGQITLAIMEGTLGEITLTNQSLVSDARLRAPLAGLHSGEVIATDALQRRLLLMQDLPGVRAQSWLAPGEQVGSADLLIDAGATPRAAGQVWLDNHGNHSTGEYRTGVALNLASPLGLGDALDLNLMRSDEGQLYYQASYALPVNAHGTRAGLSASRLAYELTGDFSALDASGTAQTTGLFVSHPWRRGRESNLSTTLAYDRKALVDDLWDGLFRSDKDARNLSLSLQGDWRDTWGGGGVTAWSVRWVHGHLTLDDNMFAPQYATGRFDKWQVSLLRLQRLADQWSLYLMSQAQLTGDNLDSSEKFSLGGAQGVRAYPTGESGADEAVLVTVELRYRLSPAWQLKGLFDTAQARLERRPVSSGDNHRHLSGVGIGVDWQPLPALHLETVAAWRTGDAVQSDSERSPRLWARLQYQF